MIALAVVTMLTGCSRGEGGPAGGVNLSGTCQFRPCVCRPDDAPVWVNGRDQPVLWNPDGTASCPAGFSLKRGKEKS